MDSLIALRQKIEYGVILLTMLYGIEWVQHQMNEAPIELLERILFPETAQHAPEPQWSYS